jgi:cupin fold WbuC family metalloprotein
MTSASFEFSQVSSNAIEYLKAMPYSATRTRRLCLHESYSSTIQMMLIDMAPHTVFPVHKHTGSDEAVYLIEGSLLYEFKSKTASFLSTDGLRSIFIPAGLDHSVQTTSAGALFLEFISGPFVED